MGLHEPINDNIFLQCVLPHLPFQDSTTNKYLHIDTLIIALSSSDHFIFFDMTVLLTHTSLSHY